VRSERRPAWRPQAGHGARVDSSRHQTEMLTGLVAKHPSASGQRSPSDPAWTAVDSGHHFRSA
jgi:hypothetical protein